ncbi:phage tail protein [Dickeya oryzae]|nr:phage tail protein [Dickeya oryzae]AJC66499.1 tail protein [Dickeya zeae EC1]
MAELTEKTEWVDGIYQIETSDPVMGGPGGISNRQANQLANRTAYLKQQQEQTGNALTQHATAANPHPQYAPLASPALTGVPTAPTAAVGTNTTQLATTAFVSTATANGLAQKIDLAEIVGIPLPWAQATAPVGWLKCNGQAFDKVVYPRLAQVYPSGVLPDLRGEFIRGWDDGRGVNPIQPLLAFAESRLAVHTHEMPTARMAVGVDGVSSTWVVVENDVSPTKVSTKQQSGGTGETAPRCVAFNYIVRAA